MKMFSTTIEFRARRSTSQITEQRLRSLSIKSGSFKVLDDIERLIDNFTLDHRPWRHCRRAAE
jgi:hypothetical protein